MEYKTDAKPCDKFNPCCHNMADLDYTNKEYYTWNEVDFLAKTIGKMIKKEQKKYDCILGITNGGIIPARLLSRELSIEQVQFIVMRKKQIMHSELVSFESNLSYLVIDDIYDSGYTYNTVKDLLKNFTCDFAFLLSRNFGCPGTTAKTLYHNKWVVFPWE
jgi:hypoxanthine phosphoribosyltransferase